MRLAAIFNVWSDWDLLDYAVENIRQMVDGVIIVGSTRSNYGEYSPIPSKWHNDELFIREPHFRIPMHAETDKRNYGLHIAKEKGYTHFITMDADEFYLKEDVIKGQEIIEKEGLAGLVVPTVSYFKHPTLCLGRDVTLVSFIHKLTPDLKHEFNHRYPYAWINGQIRIDPTRSLNINSGVKYVDDIEMHHMSHVRADYPKKIRNSTARRNLEKSTILKDFVQAKEGYYVDFYRKHLTRVENRFGIYVTNSETELYQGL